MSADDHNNVDVGIATEEMGLGRIQLRTQYAMLEELAFIRKEAQAEANLAYADWHYNLTRDHYVVYLAAQDRADAAHDELAYWSQEITE